MATAQKPNGEDRPEPFKELPPIGTRWDYANQRLTLSQKQSELAIHPAEVTLTFDSLELLFHMLFTAGLTARGVLAQVQQPGAIAVVPPSGGPSEPPRSSDPRRSFQ